MFRIFGVSTRTVAAAASPPKNTISPRDREFRLRGRTTTIWVVAHGRDVLTCAVAAGALSKMKCQLSARVLLCEPACVPDGANASCPPLLRSLAF